VGASAQVTPVQVLRDERDALIEYIAARTAETVARRVDRADIVALGKVTGVETALAGDRVRAQLASLAVERLVHGSAEGDELTLAHPQTATGTGNATPDRMVSEGDRGLWFLVRVAGDVSYVSGTAYQLAPGESGPVAGDAADQLAEAVAWVAGPAADSGSEALAKGLRSPNPRIARTAARLLADSGDREAATLLRDGLDGAGDEQRDRLAAALWRLGDREAALAAIEPLLTDDAKDDWLRRWGLAYTVDAEGRRTAELYGPDAAAAAGD
jgi:hypothetical protein